MAKLSETSLGLNEGREAVVLRAGPRLSRVEAAMIIGCELDIYDARVRRGLTRLAEILPREALAKALGAAMACRAFSGITPRPSPWS